MANNDRDQEELLTRLVVDPDFYRLERLMGEFNILEALGVVHQELRHSDFLAFLLDPAGKHGQGDYFLKRFLQAMVLTTGAAGVRAIAVSPVQLDVWSMENTQVFRELHNIDILLVDETHRLAVIVENKVRTGEHSDQLSRYRQVVLARFPQCTRVVGIYLTPEGDEPSLPEHYLSASYTLLHDLIEDVIEVRAATLGPDLLTILRHYTAMLRRHVMSESSIAELCRLLYARHKDALELIYEHRLDRQATLREELQKLVDSVRDLKPDKSTKTIIRFYPKVWDTIPELKVAEGYTPSKMILQFEIWNEPERIRLVLELGPGPEEVRQRIFNLATRSRPLFTPTAKLSSRWSLLWHEDLVPPALYAEGREEELLEKLKSNWDKFVEKENPSGLHAFTEAVCEEFGIH